MADIESLRILRIQAGDAYMVDSTVGLSAPCILGGWHFEDDGRTLDGPSGPAPVGNRGLPDPKDNPGLSVDAALALAEQACPEEWPEILRAAVYAQSTKHGWQAGSARPGQRQQVARAVLLALAEHLLAKAGEPA